MSDVTLRNAAADGAAGQLETARYYALHNGASADNTNQVSNERVQPTYDPAAASQAGMAVSLAFTGTGGQAVSHLGVWDAVSAGNFLFGVPLSGDLAFNANGDINLTAAPVTVA